MLKNTIVIIGLSLLVVSCNDTVTKKKPDNLISRDKMSDILYDLYTINAAKGISRKLLETNGFIPETYVLTKYNIDSTQFAQSNDYYAFNSDVYKDIVEKLKTRLEKEKAEYEERKQIEADSAVSRLDSIRKSKIKPKATIRKDLDTTKLKTKTKTKSLKVDSTFKNSDL